MKRKDKKLVDLIYLDKYQQQCDLKGIYQSRIDKWLEWMDHKLDKVADQTASSEEQQEYFVVNHFLRNFLVKRLQWIQESVADKELRHKYLLVLPPFNHKGNMKSFLFHFFQFGERGENKQLKFCPLNESEKEIRILWDIYKLTKTIETIRVLKESATGQNPFPSRFSNDYIRKSLTTMSEMLSLLIQICVKAEHYQDIRRNFPPGVFAPEAILNRKENDNYLVNSVTIEKFDYRNYFFHVYFKSSLKASYKGNELMFKYNYLDFEIIRQEFLLHWLSSRLKNNPRKREVLDHYMIGQKKFSDVISKNPEMEFTLLKRLPGHIFNDLIADVDKAVAPEDKVPVDPMSQNSGEFAAQFQVFGKAKELAKKTTQAMQDCLTTVKNTIGSSGSKGGEQGDAETSQAGAISDEPSFDVKVLKSKEIDYPFFAKEEPAYLEQIPAMLSNLNAEEYIDFDNNVGAIVTKKGEHLLKRKKPRDEWALPCLIKEESTAGVSVQLLILGFDVVKKELDDESAEGPGHELRPFFVYGSKDRDFDLGDPVEQRTVKGKRFFIYQSTVRQVIEKALSLTKVVKDDEET